MRTLLPALVATAAALWFEAPARADDGAVAGSYEVSYAEVSNNCAAGTGALSLSKGTLTVSVTGGKLAVDIDGVPRLVGAAPKAGKVKAQSEGDPSKADKGSKFSIGGRVDGGTIKLVFDAEHYAGKKPLCTQSWNVTGKKKS
jgi:hypothetical protein